MGKTKKIWVDNESYIDRIKKDPRIIDLAKLAKNTPADVDRWCNYDPKTGTFQSRLNDGQIIAMTFEPYNNKISSQQILFEVGYEIWLDGKTSATRGEIIQKCIHKARHYNLGLDTEINDYWLKQTLRNLKNKINNSQIAKVTRFFDVDKKQKGSYSFSIVRPA